MAANSLYGKFHYKLFYNGSGNTPNQIIVQNVEGYNILTPSQRPSPPLFLFLSPYFPLPFRLSQSTRLISGSRLCSHFSLPLFSSFHSIRFFLQLNISLPFSFRFFRTLITVASFFSSYIISPFFHLFLPFLFFIFPSFFLPILFTFILDEPFMEARIGQYRFLSPHFFLLPFTISASPHLFPLSSPFLHFPHPLKQYCTKRKPPSPLNDPP